MRIDGDATEARIESINALMVSIFLPTRRQLALVRSPVPVVQAAKRARKNIIFSGMIQQKCWAATGNVRLGWNRTDELSKKFPIIASLNKQRSSAIMTRKLLLDSGRKRSI